MKKYLVLVVLLIILISSYAFGLGGKGISGGGTGGEISGYLALTGGAITGAVTDTYVNSAGEGATIFGFSGTLGAMNQSSDHFHVFDIAYTNADHSAGLFVPIEIGNITGDAQATEYAVRIGTGWDYSLYLDADMVVRKGTTGGGILLLEGSGGGDNYIKHKAPDALAGDLTITWAIPAADGLAYLTTGGTVSYKVIGTDVLAPNGSAASLTNFPTLNQNTTGSAATLTTARTIGGVSFDGSANIDLPGVNTAGNQNTSGTAANVSGTPALPDGTTATTQSQADASTKIATTAYVDTGLGTKQATVTEGSLANLIVTGDIKDDTVGADDLAHAISSVNQAASVGDAGTLTPTAGYARVFISLTATANPSAMTLSETGAADNVVIYITNVSANVATFADSSGVQEIPGGSITLAQTETAVFWYNVDTWVHIGGKTNALSFGSITTVETEYIPISYAIDGASAPDVLETITSDTDKVNVRTFQPAADEDVLFEWVVPQDIDATSGIKYRIVFYPTNATGPSSEVVGFEMAGFSLGDGDALNGTLGTVQTSTMAAATHAQYDRCTTAWSAAMTSTHITDLSVDGETIIFKLNRDSGIASDYEQLVGVSGIELKYKRLHDATF